MARPRPLSPDSQDELLAEISRLHALLDEAAANAQIAQTKAVTDAQASLDKASAVEVRHAKELDDERGLANAARADVRELQHRIKNILATVQAIANLTLRPDLPYADARAAFNTRLQALARVQDILFERNWGGATLSSLINGIVAPHVGRGSRRLRARGPEIEVGARAALVLALALNELATNALKYGALSTDAGYVQIAWTLEADLHLRWHEQNGPSVAPPSRTGFGSRLIRDSIPLQLRGTAELEFALPGLVCTICVPARELSA